MDATTEIHLGGYRWTVTPALTEADVQRVLVPDAPIIIKDVPHRVVYRMQRPGLDIHVKHYKGDLRDWCRSLLQGRRAPREFALSREVARRGVPTLEVLGVGEKANRLGRSDSYLITRTQPDVRPLLDYLEYDLPAIFGRRRATIQHHLANRVGELLARMHQAGVRHDDLHPGNILLRLENDHPELFLIDLDMVHLSEPLDWPTSRQNLVVLDCWFALRGSRGDRMRAWHAYHRARHDLCLPWRDTTCELAHCTPIALQAHTRQLDRRCRGGNRHYVRLREGYAVRELDSEIVADPEAILADPRNRRLKHSASSTIVELPTSAMILKRFTIKPWHGFPASVFRTPAYLRSYFMGHAFRLRGLPTPRPLAAWQRTSDAGYLLVEKVPHAIPLREFLDSLGTMDAQERVMRLRAILDQLARTLRRMHEAQFSHRDLKAANILVSPVGWRMSARGLVTLPPSSGFASSRSATGSVARDAFQVQASRLHYDKTKEANPLAGASDHIWLIDLVGVRRHGKLPRRRRIRDLARLHMSFLDHPGLTRTDRLRFLRMYLAWGLFGKAGWKDWWREIDSEARQNVRRHQRVGRVVG